MTQSHSNMNKETISVMCFQNTKTKDTQPDYVVRAKIGDNFEDVGAGWRKTSTKGTMYLSLSLDADGLKKVYKEKYDKLTSAGTPVPTFEPISAKEAEINPDQAFNDF
jgi:uncharacterized protein (DUF736 family)